MAKKNKSQKRKGGKRQKGARRQPQRQMVNYSRGNNGVVDYIQTQIDPFTKSSCIPDGSNGTGCFTVKQVSQLSTGAAGTSCAQILTARVTSQSYADSGSTAATPTLPGGTNYTAGPSLTTIQALYAMYRAVSAGMKATYIGPTQTDGGLILVGQVSGQLNPSAFNGLTYAAAANLFMNFKVFPLRNGAQITWRPEDMDDQMQWVSAQGAVATLSAGPGTPYLLLIVFGATASQAQLSIEWVVNYEGQFQQQTFLSGGLNNIEKVPAEPGWYEKGKRVLSRFEQILPMVGSLGMAAVKAYSGDYMGAIGTLANGYLAPKTQSQSYIPSNRTARITGIEEID
jgi:hypothetical protein